MTDQEASVTFWDGRRTEGRLLLQFPSWPGRVVRLQMFTFAHRTIFRSFLKISIHVLKHQFYFCPQLFNH